MKRKSLGIYVHIPFCIKKCRYCDFCSMPTSDELKEKYVSALLKDIRNSAKNFLDYEIDSIYFGGGTPTCLKPKLLELLLKTIKSDYIVSDDTEITVECNPATADFDYFSNLRSCGFNRLSMGVQSVHNNELQELGRLHSFEEFDKTYNDAQRAGFTNINLDLMYGIPLQTEESFNISLETIIGYSPSHISAYALKIEKGTDFYKNRDKLILPNEDAEYNMYISAVSTLANHGYNHYEISNYAIKGKESNHNLKYWNCDDYIGFGVSAHSCIKRNRYYVVSSISNYIESIFSGSNYHVQVEEILTEKDFVEEYIMMRMRLSQGLSLKDFREKFSFDLSPKYTERMNKFINTKYVKFNGDAYAFTDEGMFLSNYFLTEILDLE